jgi:hypothetical protein
MKISKKTYLSVIIALGLAITGARADQVLISTGYNDEPREGGSFSGISYSADSGQPVPWFGSPNTTFFGSASTAQAFDPDEDAILLQNTGATSVTLTAASITGFDLFSLDSIGSPVTLDPGTNVILAGVDGSESLSGLTTVSMTIDGVTYSYSDVITADAPGGVLEGANPFVGEAESIPWTPINAVPEPTTYAMFVLGALALVFAKRRRLA